MRKIEKTSNEEEGIRIVTEFLENECRCSDGRYRKIYYSRKCGMDNQQFNVVNDGLYRRRLTNLLLQEQGNLCCYCLRRLKSAQTEEETDKLTLEHIIPRGFTHASPAGYYRSAPGLGRDKVELTDVYEGADYIQRPGVHPHKVAYHNLVASCNGTFPEVVNTKQGMVKICCNEKRSEKEAYPIYFLDGVESFVDYLPDGDIQAVPTSPEYQHTSTLITNTNLQCDTLKDIRRLWYLLRNISAEELVKIKMNPTKRFDILSRILYANGMNIDEGNRLYEKFHNSDTWETFLLYDAFYDIMREKYPA